jgi:transposase
MASVRMPDEFFDIVAHHLPPDEPVGPGGGRPRVSNRTAMKVLWYVLATGCRWRDVPTEMGCCGETARFRLKLWEAAGIWARCMWTSWDCSTVTGTWSMARPSSTPS